MMMRINPIVYGFLVLFVFFGTILAFQGAGIWSVSGKVTAGGDAIQPVAADVNTIKGWMTLEQISTTYNVPLAELLAHFQLPADTASTTAIKDLESDTFDTTALRDWLVSRTQPVLEKQITTPVETMIVPTQTPILVTTPVPTEHVVPANTVTGKTTFQELLNWGVSEKAIVTVIGSDLPAPSTIIRDFVTQKGLDFPTIKTALQTEVDKQK